MQQDTQGLVVRFKFVLFVLVNLFIALLGTAIAETAIGSFVHPQTLSGVLWKEYALSIGCAACLGFSIRRIWKTSAATWTWILPTVWFLFRVLTAWPTANVSVLGVPAHGNGIWFQISGLGCEFGARALECRNFFVFTIPFVRAAAYSIGAAVSALTDSPRRSTASAAVNASSGSN